MNGNNFLSAVVPFLSLLQLLLASTPTGTITNRTNVGGDANIGRPKHLKKLSANFPSDEKCSCDKTNASQYS
jgi:hypothetical protein